MKSFTIAMTGDVAPFRLSMDSMFGGVSSCLRAADVTLGQLECVVSERGEAVEHAKLAMRSPPEALTAIKKAGYDLMSFAGNHCMDYGRTAFFDTLEHAEKAGLKVCGAGPTLSAARVPATTKVGDTSIALLAYSSILPDGYAATERKPGCAPLRAYTRYEQVEHDQPGTPARVHTFPDGSDLHNMVADIKAAKERYDIVIVSVHWGIHFVPIEIADYQRAYAHAAIDAGADAIMGHHPHILKAIEVYKGKPVFYSLGNFAIEQPQAFDATILESDSFKHLQSLNPDIDPTSLFVCPPESRKSMIAGLEVEDGVLARAFYTPVMINDQSEPALVAVGSDTAREHLSYVEDITLKAGFETVYRRCPETGRVTIKLR